MRIVSGDMRGARILAPRSDARPTPERVREALFAILGETVRGARVLDLFAGSGALGLEALSRGAAEAVLADRDAHAVEAIERNVAHLRVEARATVLRLDLLKRGAAQEIARRLPGRRFDLVLLDPPYAILRFAAARFGDRGRLLGLVRSIALGAAGEPPLLAPGGTIVLEHPPGSLRPSDLAPLRVADARTYGDTAVAIIVAEGVPQPPGHGRGEE